MAKTAAIYARVEPDVKERAEEVLNRLGIPMSHAIDMFLRQIDLQRGIPFEMKLPEKPLSYDDLSDLEFDLLMEEAMEDIKNGNVYSAADLEAEMKRDFGL